MSPVYARKKLKAGNPHKYPATPRVSVTCDAVREIFAYDAETGVLTWRVKPSRPIAAGTVAGCLTHDGYIQVTLGRARYRAHRLIWLYATGAWPADHMDHINGDRSDNRLSNLRECSAAENAQNRAQRCTSVLIGAHSRGKPDVWRSSICVAGRDTHLGTFRTAEEAHQAYVEAKRSAHPFQPTLRLSKEETLARMAECARIARGIE